MRSAIWLVASLALACTSMPLETTCPGGAAPDVACNNAGLRCPYDGTECQWCRCDGRAFACETSATCGPDAIQNAFCPPSDSIVAGASCSNDAELCSSDSACGAGTSSTGACSCVQAVWV